MTSNPKPAARIVDLIAVRSFRLQNIGEPCELCELRAGSHVHHRRFRSQGGDDLAENFAWLCSSCHRDLHDGHIGRV